MSEESQSRKLGPLRRLRDSEMALLRALLKKGGNISKLQNQLECLCVREMPDGGMGSLYFVSDAKSPEQRRFGQRVAELQFNDVDGVKILASLNVDRDGDLFELDIWKTDFSPVVQLTVS